MAINVLIVDDDPEILSLTEEYLSRNGIETRTAESTAAADQILKQYSADLIVLDLMMEGEDGLSYCRRLRTHSSIPIIMLTAIAEDVDRIVGLEVGADDYLAKPFNPRELVARIRTVLRRTKDKTTNTTSETTAFRFGPFRLVPDEMF